MIFRFYGGEMKTILVGYKHCASNEATNRQSQIANTYISLFLVCVS